MSAPGHENQQHGTVSSTSRIMTGSQRKVDSITRSSELIRGLEDGLLDYMSLILKDDFVNKQKNVKLTLEDELVTIHSKAIQSFRTNVLDLIDLRVRHIETLEELVTEAIDKITVNRERIEDVIRRSSDSKAEVDQLESRMKTVAAFRDLFIIDNSVTDNVLASGNLDTTLLDYLELIEKKRNNCRRLLELVPNAQLAIESLNQSVEILELIYEKLFLSIKNTASTNPKSLNRALFFLQDRPHLLDQAIACIARNRGDLLGLRFVTLLRNGLESTSFDTVRFVSDMLSWLLEQFIEEQSFMDSLVRDLRSGSSLIIAALDTTLVGVFEMISMRFDSSVEQTFSVIDLFRLSRLMDFYTTKITSRFGSDSESSFMEDFAALRHKCWSKFHYQWETRVQVARTEENFFLHQNHIQALQPVPFVTETAYLLDSLLDIYTDGLSGEDSGMDDEIFSLLSSGIDPLVQLCLHITNGGGMSRIDGCVFFLNCLSSIQSPLKKYPVAADTVKNLDTLIDSEMEILVSEVTQFILKRVGLSDKLETIHRIESTGGGKEQILNEPEFHPIGLSSSLKGFYSTLFTQGIAASSGQVDLLITRELRSRARENVSKNIADAYEKIYKVISGDTLRGIATHTPEQVRTLLDV